MSTLCNGTVLREGHVWSCLDCGCMGTAWSTQHQPLQTRAALFVSCLAIVAEEASKPDDVVAGQPAA